MKKAVSTIMASIIMLFILLSIGITAYFYIKGLFIQAQGIEIVDSFCIEGGLAGEDEVIMRIRNLGSVTIKANTIQWVQTSPPEDESNSGFCCPTDINPGEVGTFSDICEGSGRGRSCIYRFIPPPELGKVIIGLAYCQ